MTWVRTDDNAPNHPKFARAGLEAYGWWHAAVCYCNRYLTDGFIATKDLPHVWPGLHRNKIQRILAQLLAQTCLEPHPDGVVIHDFLHYQPSRSDVARLKAMKAEAGRRGGLKSWELRAPSQHTAEAQTRAPAEALAQVPAEPPSHPIPTNQPSHPIPRPPDVALATGSKTAQPTRAEQLAALARASGLTPDQLAAETAKLMRAR